MAISGVPGGVQDAISGVPGGIPGWIFLTFLSRAVIFRAVAHLILDSPSRSGETGIF